MSDEDPRVFFAAERTLLAWLRTGVTLMALGFVVSHFGLFVRLLAIRTGESSIRGSFLSAGLGVAFAIAGTLTVVLAAIQHQRFVSALPQANLPRGYSRVVAVALSVLVSILGIALAVYLLVTQP